MKIDINSQGHYGAKIVVDGTELRLVTSIATTFEVGCVPRVDIGAYTEDTTITIEDGDLFLSVFDRKFRVLGVL